MTHSPRATGADAELDTPPLVDADVVFDGVRDTILSNGSCCAVDGSVGFAPVVELALLARELPLPTFFDDFLSFSAGTLGLV